MNQLTTLYSYLKQLAEADSLVNSVMKTVDRLFDYEKHLVQRD